MAIAGHDHHLGHRLHRPDGDRFQPEAAGLPAKRKRKPRSVSSRLNWILAGMMLGATAGWMIFRAFLALITLD